MSRMFRTATLLAITVIAACKTSDKPAAPVAASKPAAAPTAPGAAPELPTPAPAEPAAAPPGKPAEPAAAAPGNTDLETRGLAAMDKMADLFVADARDCDKLAADLRAFIADNKPLIAQLAGLEERASADQRTAFTRRNAGAQAAIGQKMQAGLTACASNPAVLTAMKDFPGE